ncbi:GntR family transcriptional regulator [Actinophytocola xinjiangensis]|nr:GntR family transcriptional regulator [Actinophytocola xinjiangensis]
MTALSDLVKIDRMSPVPLYFQMAARIRELIESGRLEPGHRLDNEMEVAAQLGLSRPTVRQAMQLLVDQGLLSRKRGIGTTVVSTRVRRMTQLTSLYEDLERSGRKPSTRVLSYEVVPAAAEVADALAVPMGADVLSIRRLRFADGEPLAILRNYLRADLGVTEDELADRGLYQILRDLGSAVRSIDQLVGARKATAAEASLLDEERDATLLTVERTAHDTSGRPVEYGRDLYRASLYTIHMSATNP